MTNSPTWHDTTREAGTLTIENKVYRFDGKKTTDTKELDKWLRNEYDLDGLEPGIPYRKIKAVEVETKKFREVEKQ